MSILPFFVGSCLHTIRTSSGSNQRPYPGFDSSSGLSFQRIHTPLPTAYSFKPLARGYDFRLNLGISAISHTEPWNRGTFSDPLFNTTVPEWVVESNSNWSIHMLQRYLYQYIPSIYTHVVKIHLSVIYILSRKQQTCR